MKPAQIASIAALVAFAAVAKEEPPPLAAARGFKLAAVKEYQLDNGLKVTLVPYGQIPKVSAELYVRTGGMDEAADQAWISQLVAQSLLEGSQAHPAAALAQTAASLGGELATRSDTDRTVIAGDALGEGAPGLVALIAEVARTPAFPEADVLRKRADLARGLAVRRSIPQQIASERFRAALYGDHPYGRRMPTPEQVASFTPAQVRAFWAANAGAKRAHLFVAGVFDQAAVEAAIKSAFGAWEAGPAPTSNPPKAQGGRRVQLIDRPNAPQSTVYLGLPVIDPSSPDAVALDVTNRLLGGSFGSRITQNIREAKGYTYSPFSTVSARPHDAFWAEIADVTAKDTGAAIQEILGELKRLRTEPPTDAELKAIQAFASGIFVLQNSSRDGIIGQLAFLDLHGLPLSWLETLVDRVNAVTPAQVQQIAQKYLQEEQCAIVVVGDDKSVRPQLQPFGEVK